MAVVPHNRLTFGPEESRAVAEVVKSGHWAGGSRTVEMERRLTVTFSVEHAVGVGSGTGALRLVLKALGVGPGDDVLVPAYSCVAIANTALALGARPVPVDCLPGEWTIDPAAAARAVSARAKVAVAVNTFGMPSQARRLQSLGLRVVEDCAHGFRCAPSGAPYPITADAAIFSFYATKLIAGGEGGAVLTNDQHVAEVVRQWRAYADAPADGTRLNDKMTDLEAALVLCQLDRLSAMIEARAAHARDYMQELAPLVAQIKGIELPLNSAERVWYRYAIRVPPARHQRIVAGLGQSGITVEKPIEPWLDCQANHCANSADAYAALISIPLYPSLSSAERTSVIDALRRVLPEDAVS